MTIFRLPQNDNTNGWSGILPPRSPHASLQDNIQADWLVIGAGFAGLAAARRLAQNRPDDRIVVLEAGICGENASGRNSGFVIDLPHTVSSDLGQLDGSQRYLRLARAAISELETVVQQQNIDCDWSQDGKYHAAVTADGSRAMLEPYAAELTALGEPFTWVERDALAAKLGTPHFERAIYTPGCVLINPAALTRGLADTLPDNVTLFENTPVTKFLNVGTVGATTPSGSVKAPRAILAANGFSDQFGHAKKQFVHLALCASLTRPLTQSEQSAFGVATPWGLTPANGFGGITMRYTNDRRILIRQDIRLAMGQKFSAQRTKSVAQNHQRLLAARFPAIASVQFENSWVGYICMSRNGAPKFGNVAPNIWMAACQNGIGITKGTISGVLAADKACEIDNPLITDMEDLGTPTRLPPRPLVEIGARALMQWELWKNRKEA
ncbi:MAG: glycine/D-amino acid oxidase-like deaminating enzyme [Yoonia sp.]|jgi:glycine/D-amino acid oxidase-like deaminating enzyme